MALGLGSVKVGVWTDDVHHTGCTVVLPPAGTLGAAAVRGGAPGTREVPALGHIGAIQECHAVVLSGGSAFGLATADGVVRWCEAQGIGYDKMVARIPIVGGAIIFDLREPGARRPDAAAGWSACEAATAGDPPMGSVGVGAGCTVGKIAGPQWATKGGQGWAVASAGGISVGALVAVNPLGEVLADDGSVLAGTRAPAGAPRFPEALPLYPPTEAEHTVIGCLVSNARLSKPDAVRAVDLAHSGIARAITPAHTTYDGDALFLLCTQERTASVDLVAHLGATAVARAIRAGVRAAQGIPGFPADPRAQI